MRRHPPEVIARRGSATEPGHTLDAGLAFESAGMAIVVTDEHLRITAANPAYGELVGSTPDELIGTSLASAEAGADAGAWAALRQGPRDGPPDRAARWQGEVRCRHRDGRTLLAWMSLVSVPDATGIVRSHVATFADITAVAGEREALRRMAQHDPLTDLPNRRAVQTELDRGVSRARRHRQRLAVLFIDLDRFKWINDTLGHEVGDHALKEIARRLRAAVRTEDLVARWGGDEFVVVLDDIGAAAQVSTTANAILAAIATAIDLGAQHLSVSASIGIACFPDDATTPDQLIAAADAAMYQAKRDGRGVVAASGRG